MTRYLCAKYSKGNMCPDTLRGRAEAEKWMDWSSLSLAPFNSAYLDHFFRLPEDQRNPDAITAATERASSAHARIRGSSM